MAKFTTAWHRFNTVVDAPLQTPETATNNIIGSGTGNVILNLNDELELSNPTVVNSDGDTSTFSSVIPTDAIITGIQYQVYLDFSNTNNSNILYHYPKIGTTEITDVDGGATTIGSQFVYGGSLEIFKSSIVDEDLGLGSDLSLSNVNNIKFKLFYGNELTGGQFIVIGTDFEDANGPSPAVRLEYELPPKVTIINGSKLSITNGKMHIV